MKKTSTTAAWLNVDIYVCFCENTCTPLKSMVLAKKRKKQKTGTGQIFNLYLKMQKVAYNQLIKMEQNNGIHLKAFNFQQKK